jgi:hypothetical protein
MERKRKANVVEDDTNEFLINVHTRVGILHSAHSSSQNTRIPQEFITDKDERGFN